MFNALISLETLRSPKKLEIKIPGHLTLVLAMAVEQVLSSNDPANVLRKMVSEDDQKKLVEVVMEMLQKAGLEEFYRKLKEIAAE